MFLFIFLGGGVDGRTDGRTRRRMDGWMVGEWMDGFNIIKHDNMANDIKTYYKTL